MFRQENTANVLQLINIGLGKRHVARNGAGANKSMMQLLPPRIVSGTKFMEWKHDDESRDDFEYCVCLF